MKLSTETQVKGEFQFIKYNANLEKIYQSPVCHNDVLNIGLNRMHTSWWAGVAVGTSGEPTSLEQTSLRAFFARTSNIQVSAASVYEPEQQRYKITQTYRFPAGTFNNTNLAEVGLDWGGGTGNPVWNRALIRDALGEPTVITMLADEYLDVVVTLYLYPDYSTQNVSIPLYDGKNNFIRNITGVFKPENIGEPLNVSGGNNIFSGFNPCVGIQMWNATNTSLGILSSGGTGNTINTPYDEGSYQFVRTWKWGLNSGNGLIKRMRFNTSSITYELILDEPLEKKTTQEYLVTLEMNWGRYAA